jgi:predicted alpha/beta superfamily hydrolase
MNSLSVRCIFVVVLVLGCVSAPPPTTPESPAPATPTLTLAPGVNPGKAQNAPGIFYSYAVQDKFTIYVGLPTTYDPESSDQYHTIYLLDGDWYFDGSHWRMPDNGVKGIVRTLSYQGLIPESIVVGIGYPRENNRGRDFLWDYNNFYAFLINELIPFIDENYNTDVTGRTLIGHSDGAFFTLHAFFQCGKPDNPFTNFIAVSGDFTKINDVLFAEEMALHQRSRVVPASLYMAVGGLEEVRFISSNRQMAEILGKRDYTDFRLIFKEYYGLNHSSIVSVAFQDGLLWIFSDE